MSNRDSWGGPRVIDCKALKDFMDCHFPDKKEPDEMELQEGLFHEIAIIEPEITMDDLEKAHEITKDILESAEEDLLHEADTKTPLDQIEITRLMLAIGCTPYWEIYVSELNGRYDLPPVSRRYPHLRPIAKKYREVLRKKGKME